ncbi:MAG: nucleotidyltransferase family protein [Patescibacteria group bacterium]
MTIQAIKKKIVPVLKRQGVTKAALFGSCARGETKKRSDIDLLVKLKKGKSLFDFVGLKLELEDKLGKKVDLVEYTAIKPLLKDYILKDEKIIYEKKRS